MTIPEPSILKAAYDALEVAPGCSGAELQSAYRRLVRRWHPDRHAGDERLRVLAEERTKRLNAAYATIRDARRRHLDPFFPRPGSTPPRTSTPPPAAAPSSAAPPRQQAPPPSSAGVGNAPQRTTWRPSETTRETLEQVGIFFARIMFFLLVALIQRTCGMISESMDHPASPARSGYHAPSTHRTRSPRQASPPPSVLETWKAKERLRRQFQELLRRQNARQTVHRLLPFPPEGLPDPWSLEDPPALDDLDPYRIERILTEPDLDLPDLGVPSPDPFAD